ncbi:MAG: 23S rRNA (adenine(2503)-C(2))-methyltransferase RlmN [Candidatus Brocadiia bacterium]
MTDSEPKPFYSLTKQQVAHIVTEHKLPAYRAAQVWKHAYSQGGWGFERATAIPKGLHVEFEEAFPLKTAVEKKRLASSDGDTEKFLFEFPGNSFIEAVVIGAPGRTAVCLSTQVGCDLGCTFCASAHGGKQRDLLDYEIIEEFVASTSLSGRKITHVVFMGMGEPLLNLHNVISSIKALVDPDRFGISHRRITVSTIGVVPGIRELAKSELGVSLAISLHAPNQELRARLIPSAKKWLFDDIIEAARFYQETTGRQVTFEYCLIDGVNDSPISARELARKLKSGGYAINIIPLNPIPGCEYRSPVPETVDRFKNALVEAGLTATVRREKGADIGAACGQLRREGV